MRGRLMITKTFYVAFKYFKYWREHSMVGDFEVTYSCLQFLPDHDLLGLKGIFK